MNEFSVRYILGSRSPRRSELFSYLVPEDRITVIPPCSTEEKSFAGLSKWNDIIKQITEISIDKMDDVLKQITAEKEFEDYIILTADTVVIVQEKETDQYSVLGQPPETSDWKSVVRGWFEKYYLNQDHFVVTAFSLHHSNGSRMTETVKTTVRFRSDSLNFLEWYLSTEESIGKAGGYGIQGKGSIFLDRMEGSLSNVIGLPLNELSLAIDQIKSESA